MADAALWDRVDDAIAELHTCQDLEDLTARVCPLVLACLPTPFAVLARVSDNVWSPWRAAPIEIDMLGPLGLPAGPADGSTLAFADAIAEGRVTRDPRDGTVTAPVPIDGTVVAVLHLSIEDPDALPAVRVLAHALGATYALLEIRRRAAAQEQAIAALVAALASETGDLIELLEPTTVHSSHRAGSAADERPGHGLTERQSEVLQLMALGLSNAEIADRMLVTVATVKSHVHKVLAALGAVNRAEAIARHARAGRGTPPGSANPPTG